MKNILLVNTGARIFREYILKELVNLDYKLFVLTDQSESWSTEYAEKKLEVVNFQDSMSQILMFAENNNINGVLTYSEEDVIITNVIAKKLNLPYLDIELAKIFKNKYLLRKALDNLKIPSVKFQKIENYEDAKEFLKESKYPIIIKPQSGHSSIGVHKIYDDYELFEAIKNLKRFKFKEGGNAFLIEEFIKGTEVSVEAYVDNYSIVILGITDKRLSDDPFFEEIGHTFPSTLSNEVKKNVEKYCVDILSSLKVNTGVFHIEVKIDTDGPKLIEIGARMGGDMIPKLFHLSTNISLSQIAAQLSCGVSPYIKSNKGESTSIEFLIPDKEGFIKNFDNANENLLKDFIIEEKFWAIKNQEVLLPPHKFLTRLGYVIVKSKQGSDSSLIATNYIDNIFLDIEVD